MKSLRPRRKGREAHGGGLLVASLLLLLFGLAAPAFGSSQALANRASLKSRGLWEHVGEVTRGWGRGLEESKDRLEGSLRECSKSVQAVASHVTSVDIVEEVDRCLDSLAVSIDHNLGQLRSAWCGGQAAVCENLKKIGEGAQGTFQTVLAEVRSPFEHSGQVTYALMDRLRSFGKASAVGDEARPGRRKSSAQQIRGLNDQALQSVLKFVQESDGWEHVVTSEGVTVYRKYLDLNGMSGVVIDGESIAEDKTSDAGSSNRFACVKAVGVVDAPVEKVFELFLDNTRVHEYNEHCREIADIDKLSDNTKVTWSRSSNYGPFKARDFCTIVHYRRLQDGSLVVVNRAAEHVKAPRSDKYVRSQILLAGNVMKPHPKDPNKTLLVTLTHINPGGSVDNKAGAMMMNMLTANSPVSFIRRVEMAARRSMEPHCSQDPSLDSPDSTGHLEGFFHATVV